MNILLYVVDALRADHLGCYGYHRPTSPHLDRLAEEAVLFENAFANATWTRASAGVILTSTYPSVHGALNSSSAFAPRTPTLAETLQSQGLHTFGVSAMANVSTLLGFSKGFETFKDLYKEPALIAKRAVVEIPRFGEFGKSQSMVMPLAEDVNAYALPLVQESGQEPFFLFMWPIDPHNPYWPPAGYRRFLDPMYRGRMDGSLASIRAARTPQDMARLVDLYDGEVLYTDHCFGQLRAELERLGLWDETLVIVTSDHGQAFNEHGHMLHAHIPYEELLRVPLLIKPPRSWPVQRQRVPELVSHLDIVPTILEFAGVQAQASGQQGHSILPLLRAPGEINEFVYSECQPAASGAYFSSVRSARWKYTLTEAPTRRASWRAGLPKLLRNRKLLADLLLHPRFYWKRQFGLQREMLFDLQADPGEQVNVRDRYPEQRQALAERWAAWREANRTLAERGPAAEFTMDQATEDQLKGLGYL